MFTSRFEETRGGRVPQKSKICGDVVYGWSLTGLAKREKFKNKKAKSIYDGSLWPMFLKAEFNI